MIGPEGQCPLMTQSGHQGWTSVQLDLAPVGANNAPVRFAKFRRRE
jgi:hypothetical protein